MNSEKIKLLLKDLRNGSVSVDEVFEAIRRIPYEDIGFAKIDNHRMIRTGMPEVIYSEGKTADQVRHIARTMRKNGSLVLATRASGEMYSFLKTEFSDALYHEHARIISIGDFPEPSGCGEVLVLTGGSSDIPVAEEAGLTARALGCSVSSMHDVGIAGVHRLFDNLDTIQSADVIIAVAGMEGALPSLVAGLVNRPVIAVPTSVGYGASLGGISALLTMLNSCAPGVAVVNIDNGFGAGCLASMINRSRR